MKTNLILPTVLFFAIFFLIPIVTGIFYSFKRVKFVKL
jgi:ABC-type sugar transport system permease subunit